MRTSDPDAERFAAMFREHSPRVYAYARRRCEAQEADDVVAETFLVAWRRWSELPPAALPWLLVVARNTIANLRRGTRRRDHLADTLGRLERVAGPAGATEDAVIERATLIAALAALTDVEREALLLVAWDGLTGPEAARVAGCSTHAFEVRLSRARARLIREGAEPPTHRTHHHLGVATSTPLPGRPCHDA